MDWTLFWQIAGPIIGLLGIGVGIILFLWPRRERVKIKITTLNYHLQGSVNEKLTVELSGSVVRSGGKEVRSMTGARLKPDKHTLSILSQCFKFDNALITFRCKPLNIPKDANKPFGLFQTYLSLDMNKSQNIKQELAYDLSQKTFEVSLVWNDNEKAKWKKITQEDYGKWV